MREEVGEGGRSQTARGLEGCGGVGFYSNVLRSYEGFLGGKSDQIWT